MVLSPYRIIRYNVHWLLNDKYKFTIKRKKHLHYSFYTQLIFDTNIETIWVESIYCQKKNHTLGEIGGKKLKQK
jgi:hypothetical protein